ncbi:metallopeptidase, catalytic domain-containing protein [Tanacetum coccineum]
MWLLYVDDDLRLHIRFLLPGSSAPLSSNPGNFNTPSYSPELPDLAQNLGKAECSKCWSGNGFQTSKKYRHVPKKPNASSSGNKKKGVEPTIEKNVEFLGECDSEDEVASVDNDMAQVYASRKFNSGPDFDAFSEYFGEVPYHGFNGNVQNGVSTEKHYGNPTPRWPVGKTHLTYAFDLNFQDSFVPPVVSAFDEWASGSGYFTFSRVADIGTSDLKISFQKMNHGDGADFDGPLGTLAHAYGPPDGRLHFDADETWSLGPGPVPNTYDFKTVTVHEIGHLLGLHHSTDPNAVMFPTGAVKDKLASDDIQGIKVLYGVSNSNPFEVLNSVDDDVEFGTNANLENNEATTSGSSFMNVDNSNTELSGDYESEDEVESVDNYMARSMASERAILHLDSQWEKKTHLTYAFGSKFPDSFVPPVVSAFNEWASRFGYFTFSRVADIGTSDLKISSQKINHGDTGDFDGPSGILAHAYAPPDGRLHFDADETWSLGPGQFIMLLILRL